MERCFITPRPGDFYGTVSLLLNGIITMLVAIAGILGNVFSILLVSRFHVGKELLVLLVVLALWDLGVLVCALGFYSAQTVFEMFGSKPAFFAYLTKLLNGPSTTSMTGSIWTVVCITVVRYLAVSNPFSHRIGATKRRAGYVSLCVLLLSFVFTLPRYFELRVVPCVTADGNTSQDVSPSRLRSNPQYQLYYRSVLCSLLVSFCPFVLCLVLSIRIIFVLRRCFQEAVLNAALSTVVFQNAAIVRRVRRTERRISILMLVLLAKFLSCYTLPTTLNMIEMVRGHKVFVEVYFAFLADLSNFLVVLNSATNFVVYFWWRQTHKRKQRSRASSFRLRNAVNKSPRTPRGRT